MAEERSSLDVLRDKEHISTLLKQLNEMRETETYCDITLVAEGRHFPCHRVVLGAASSYFNSLFSLEMKEKDKILVDIQNIPPDTLASILDYIYTGKMKVKHCDVMDIICAADYLLLNSLKEKASHLLIINTESAAQLLSFADKYNCFDLKVRVLVFIEQHFTELELLDIDGALLGEILASENLVIPKEEVVYEHLTRWVEHDPDNRKCKFPDLFKHLRIGCFDRIYLRDVVRKHPLVQSSAEVTMVLCDGMSSLLIPELPADQERSMCLPRRSTVEDIVIITGGLRDDTNCQFPEHDCLGFSIAEKTWYLLAGMNYDHSHHASIICGSFLYAIGGEDSHGRHIAITERLDLRTGSWADMPAMETARSRLSVVLYQGKIFAIGGKSDSSLFLGCCEAFDPLKQEWETKESLNIARYEHSTVVCGEHMYVIGGYANIEGKLRTVERYSALSSSWEFVSSMIKRRIHTSAVSYRNKIYVMGGIGTDSEELSSCEIYNPDTDEWASIPPMIVPRCGHASVIVKDRIMVFGGGTHEDAVLSIVEEFDIDKKSWDFVESDMPWPLIFLQCCVTQLPKAFIRKQQVIQID